MRRSFNFTNSNNLASNFDAEASEQLLGNGTYSYTNRSFTCAGTLQNVPKVLQVIFETSVQIRMTRTRAMYAALLLVASFNRFNVHNVAPMLPVIIFDNKSYRRPRCISMTNPANNLSRILLNLHAPTSAVSLLAASQFKIQSLEIKFQIAWQAFNNRCQLGTVCLP
ncbi:hypothetical protein D3C71_1558870 [compost metagenome]